jgi:3-deoxy-D-manno-octulosonic-acid transferase
MIVIYRALLMMLAPFYFFTIFFSKKTRDYITKRPQSFEIDTSKHKTIWVHASSGEFEHAKSLIRTLKEKHPLKKIVFTYSSPSYVYAIKQDSHIDAYLPMPFDSKGPISSIIRKINPEVVLFARTDVWPELAYQLKKRGIPSLVFARAETGSTGYFKRLYYKMTLLKTSKISFVTERDKGNFISTVGKSASKIKLTVDGDPRVDEVFNKMEYKAYKSLNPESDSTIILGSVWPEDLEVISNPLRKAVESGLITKIIVAPHDPSEKHIAEIKTMFEGFTLSLYSEEKDFKSTVTIVDQVGVLFDLYSEAKVAFVGGSFKAKVHSVIEPLAKGLPVITGPKIKNNSEAQTYSKKPYEFVKVSKDEDSFLAKLKAALKEDNFEISESISMQKGSSNKIEEQIDSLM